MNRADIIGQRIRNLRGDIPREKMAKDVEISTSALAMYETGQRIPRDEVKVKIAQYLNTTVENIFFAQ